MNDEDIVIIECPLCGETICTESEPDACEDPDCPQLSE